MHREREKIRELSKIIKFSFDTKIKFSEGKFIMSEELKELLNLYEIGGSNLEKLVIYYGKLYKNGKSYYILDIKDLLSETELEIFW
jgi:hypothetical protein